MALALALAEVDGVTEGDGHGVGGALLTAVPDGLAEPDVEGFGVGVGLAVADPDGLAVGAGAQSVGPAEGASSVWFPGELLALPPSRSKAAGTTSKPRMTVITKASAPHSVSQNERDEFRIRARRPFRAEVCCAY